VGALPIADGFTWALLPADLPCQNRKDRNTHSVLEFIELMPRSLEETAGIRIGGPDLSQMEPPTAKSDQSARSAVVGLILAARCAGIQAAARPTDASASIATASVAGS